MSKKILANLSALAFGTLILSACSSGSNTNSLVQCYGVAKGNGPLLMTKDMCDSLDATKQTPLTNQDYVHCYGVAGAAKNGCATKTNSCGGKMKKARAPDAWVAVPLSICQNLKGGVVAKAE